jgi:hypothetical protein
VIIVVIWRRRNRKTVEIFLRGSTEAVSFHYDLAPYFDPERTSGPEWQERGKYYLHELIAETKEFEKFVEFFGRTLDGTALLRSNCIQRVFEVYNPALASNFAVQRSILEHRIRNDPKVFAKTDWQHDRFDLRRHVKDRFNAIVSQQKWNEEEKFSPVIPVVHGTNSGLAWKIVETGFASLAALDAGWYGSGIYFTTSSLYAAPYYMTSTTPALVVCLVNPGNPYPVIEERTDPDSLMGQPIKAGYQSNHVSTNKQGKIFRGSNAEGYDEIVIPQEAQIMPIYLIELNYAATEPVAKNFQRSVPTVPQGSDGM